MRAILSSDSSFSWQGATSENYVIVDASAYYAAFYRAASLARNHILILGWQFDTGVKLLRGDAARAAPYPVELLPFLDALCRERPALRVYILAWDYSLVYSLEREWLQSLKFEFQSSPRVRFEFDAHPQFGGSHHQKLVVVDGALAFVGGLDLCEERWDDRSHQLRHPLRVNGSGLACRPNHEVQASVQGDAAVALMRVFGQRWLAALGEDLPLSAQPDSPVTGLDLQSIEPSAILELRAERVATAMTLPSEKGAGVRTIQGALTAALLAAERLIYVETQYFTSRTLTSVLLQRLAAADRPRLQVLVVMPRGADNSKEKFALGDLQSAMLSELEQAAKAHGHELRFLCSAVDGTDCEAATFIHSKLLIVDDELLCIGSANITERSMSVDSELCLIWQAPAGTPLAADIQRVRASLLAEHSGRAPAELLDATGLTAKLDDWLEQGNSRLRVCHFDPASVSPIKQAIFDPGAPSQPG
jgi:phospholipase D1/2